MAQNCKTVFWRAHGLAAYFGFKTLPNYSDYLLADPTTTDDVRRELEGVITH
jgi:hypothetical protein